MIPKARRFKVNPNRIVQKPIIKPKIHDCCILFPYHKDSALTFRHHELLKKHNPHTPVIPLSHGCSAIPDTFNISKLPSLWDESNQWRSMDVFFYKWFMNRTVTAKRYVLVEYDVYTEISVNDYFSDVWDNEVGTPHTIGLESLGKWQWFGEIHSKLPAHMQANACGIVPLATTLVSHDALAKITDQAKLIHDAFCELRMGTAIKSAKMTPKIISKSAGVRHHFGLVKKQKYKTFYHPIKNDGDIDRVLSK